MKQSRNKSAITSLPSTQTLEKELEYEKDKKNRRSKIKNVIFTLITVFAIAAILSTMFMPVLRIYGTSMSPSLSGNDFVLAAKHSDFRRGDIIAFYYNNKVLVKRIVALSGEYVSIDKSGNLYINNEYVEEPYISKKALGECDIEFPYQVPEGKLFVLGDSRTTSIDSRSSTIGCVSQEQILGKVIFCIWPMSSFGIIN
jgi:signal peptidase I